MAKKKTTGWFKTGKDGRKQSKQVDEEQKQRRASAGIQRFWQEADSSGKVTFLDNPDFFLNEHNINIGGKWFNYFTCLKDFDTCPLCESGDKPAYAVVCTVIDHRKYTDSEGKERVNEKKLFVARGKARQILLKRLEEKHEGDMAGCVYEVGRGTTKTEASTGEDFDFLQKKLTKKQLKSFIPKGGKEDAIKPFDYEEVMAPKKVSELRKLVGAETPVGSEDEDDKDTGTEPEDTNGGEEEEVSSIEDLL